MKLDFGCNRRRLLGALAACALLSTSAFAAKPKTTLQSRDEYISRVQQQQGAAPSDTTIGSLWVPGGRLTAMSVDYKAHNINDTIIIQVLQETTSQATGDTNTQRAYSAQSAVTALPGKLKVGGVNPLFGANSATQLKSQGETSSSTKLQTSLAGQVISVLPNGNLVIEAQREVFLNREKETAIVRGVVRPGDVAPDNTVPSTALANLEIELKGRGVVSDAAKPPSLIMKLLTKILTF
ncbi:MAG TPA: flagellar basal body L-ring protein FlgH [Terriglobales bacterium]|nr:flagellar basal body L-ring protein FlgH [Terriglobales bacterium]